MAERDAFETTYGRLAATRIVVVAATDAKASPAGKTDTPRSRLLPRLALMAPKGRSLTRS